MKEERDYMHWQLFTTGPSNTSISNIYYNPWSDSVMVETRYWSNYHKNYHSKFDMRYCHINTIKQVMDVASRVVQLYSSSEAHQQEPDKLTLIDQNGGILNIKSCAEMDLIIFREIAIARDHYRYDDYQHGDKLYYMEDHGGIIECVVFGSKKPAPVMLAIVDRATDLYRFDTTEMAIGYGDELDVINIGARIRGALTRWGLDSNILCDFVCVDLYDNTEDFVTKLSVDDALCEMVGWLVPNMWGNNTSSEIENARQDVEVRDITNE